MAAKVLLFSGEESGCDGSCVESMKGCFDSSDTLETTVVPMASFDVSSLDEFDVIAVPGGDVYTDEEGDDHRSTMLGCLGPSGLDAIAQQVRDNGKIYIGVCAGTFLALEVEGFGLKDRVRAVSREMFGYNLYGQVRGNIRTQPAAGARDALIQAVEGIRASVWYDNGPLLEVDQDTDIRVLATYSGELAREWDDGEQTDENEAAWQEQGGQLNGTPAVVACRVGKGVVLLCSPHPELTESEEDAAPLVLPALIAAAQEWRKQFAA